MMSQDLEVLETVSRSANEALLGFLRFCGVAEEPLERIVPLVLDADECYLLQRVLVEAANERIRLAVTISKATGGEVRKDPLGRELLNEANLLFSTAVELADPFVGDEAVDGRTQD